MRSIIYFSSLILMSLTATLYGSVDQSLTIQHIANTKEILGEHCQNNPKVLQMYDTLTDAWLEYDAEHPHQFNFSMAFSAIEFAAIKHEGQTRKDAGKTPYIIHPLGVTYNLWNEGGIRSINVLTAALLHDTLEDTETTENEIASSFGPRVLETVKELTDDPNLDGQENKRRQVDHAPMMSMDAQLVKLADRLYNIRDTNPKPPSWSNQQVETYKYWGRLLLNALRGTNAGLEAALETELQK